MEQRTLAELEQGVAEVLRSPADVGVVELILRRPAVGERELLDEATLDCEVGVVGDNWKVRGSTRTADGSAHPEMQINIMNSRAIALIAGPRERWQLAGDELFVDLDLGEANLPPGTLLQLGSAIVEVTTVPHLGCAKFSARFGVDALRFVNTASSRARRIRGVNVRVVAPGTVRTGDLIRRLDVEGAAAPPAPALDGAARE